MIGPIAYDVRQVFRGLRRDLLFAGMAVVTLGLGVGASSTMFGIIDRVLLRGPENVVAPNELARLYVTRTRPGAKTVTLAWQPYVLSKNVKEQMRAFSAVATYTPEQARAGRGADSRLVPVTFATSDFFSLTGVHPALGRFFSADEDRPPVGQPVVVLGYGYWQREFSGDRGVIGKTVTLQDREFRIIGVAPRGFTGVERAPVDAWLPMTTRTIDDASPDWTDWRSNSASIVVRLATPRPVAAQQLTALIQHAYVGPHPSMRTASVSLRPISYSMQGVEPPELGVAEQPGT